MKRLIATSTMMVLAAACSHAAAQAPQYGAPLLPVPHGSQQYVASTGQQSWNYASYSPEHADPPAPDHIEPTAEHAGTPEYSSSPEIWGSYGCDNGGCDNGGCDSYGGDYSYFDDCCGKCGGCWYGGVYALMMTRDEQNDVWLSYDTNDLTSEILSSNMASMEWEPGLGVTVGRYFDCGWAIEATYWGIFSNSQSAYAYDPAPPAATVPNLNTSFDLSGLDYDNGITTDSVQDWYDGAQVHRVRRDYSFHNLELNFVRGGYGYGGGCCATCRSGCGLGCGNKCCSSNLCLDWFGGVRYFRFDEDFEYGTNDISSTFGGDPLGEQFYNIDIDNNLIGFQVGGRAEYRFGCKFSLYAGTKLGLYGNYMNHHSRIGGANGAATVNNGPNNGREWDIYSNKTDVSMMGELDLGMAYSFLPGWQATLGYRAVAVTGVALTTNQIPRYFEDVDGVANIDSNGSLILHGAYCGLEYNW